MIQRRLIQRLIRRRLIAMPSGSVSETYPKQVEVIVQPMGTGVEEQFIKRIEELISRHRKTAIPAALQVEYETYPRLYEEVASLNNEIVDYLQAHQIVPSGKLITKLLQLQQLGHKYVKKLQKVASYLGKPMPTLTEMKPIPGIVMLAGMGLLRERIIRRVM